MKQPSTDSVTQSSSIQSTSPNNTTDRLATTRGEDPILRQFKRERKQPDRLDMYVIGYSCSLCFLAVWVSYL